MSITVDRSTGSETVPTVKSLVPECPHGSRLGLLVIGHFRTVYRGLDHYWKFLPFSLPKSTRLKFLLKLIAVEVRKAVS